VPSIGDRLLDEVDTDEQKVALGSLQERVNNVSHSKSRHGSAQATATHLGFSVDRDEEMGSGMQRVLYESYSTGPGVSGTVNLGNSILGAPKSETVVTYRW